MNNTPYHKILLIILSLLMLNCSDDDGTVEEFLSVLPSLVSFNAINTCDIGDPCCLATEFDFRIGYEANGDTELNNIQVSILWSDGDTDTFETDDFNDFGTEVVYDWCYRFGESAWVEVTHVLVGRTGARSPASSVRVEKPDGAN